MSSLFIRLYLDKDVNVLVADLRMSSCNNFAIMRPVNLLRHFVDTSTYKVWT